MDPPPRPTLDYAGPQTDAPPPRTGDYRANLPALGIFLAALAAFVWYLENLQSSSDPRPVLLGIVSLLGIALLLILAPFIWKRT